MSSRVLRRLQKEQELERQLAAARAAEAEDEAEDDEEEEQERLRSSKTINAFNMLDGADEQKSDSSDGDEGATARLEDEKIQRQSLSTPSKPSKPKKKKKKAKKKGKEKVEQLVAHETNDPEMDEIDRALNELSTSQAMAGDSKEAPSGFARPATMKLLGIDTKYLNPLNEMRSLFGNVALEGSSASRSSPRPQRRREQNQQGGVDLATALTGEYSPASKRKSLGALASRRNVFMQGKEEWPLATSGGLSMEREEDPSTRERKYSIAHSTIYKYAQQQFRLCVESMDPQNMIEMLMYNPYHIASLLQVSEIAKHQGDHSVSADLLERALFSFGRSVHSSFPVAMREGAARLAFNKPANRELYLTIWRYIKNLEMRGTWRTAFEWAKLLLQLDPRSDPYGVTMVIDQFALRARQHAALIELCSEETYGLSWSHLPNMQISLALAYHRSSQPTLARETLAIAMHKYPYVLSALASALDIAPLPPSLWAKLPSTDAEKLYTMLYATQAKDLWNTPETTSLLVEVAQTLDHYTAIIKSAAPAAKLEISLEEARHIMLLEIPQLIAVLPRRFTDMRTSASDVLPPPDSVGDSEFTSRAPTTRSGGPGVFRTTTDAAVATAGVPIGAVNDLVSRVMAWFAGPARRDEAANENGETDGQVARRELDEALGADVSEELVQEMVRQGLVGQVDFEDADDEGEVRNRPLLASGTEPSGAVADFDYHLERENAPNGEDEIDGIENSISGLGRISVEGDGGSIANENRPMQVDSQNPHAVTIEEVADDDNHDGVEHGASTSTGPGRYVLRNVDSDDDDDVGRADSITAARSGIQRDSQQPRPGWTTTNTAVPNSPTSTQPLQTQDSLDVADPQRIQRWLLSAGLQDLQSSPDDASKMSAYVENLKKLRPQQQGWVVSMVRQRAEPALAEQILSRLGR